MSAVDPSGRAIVIPGDSGSSLPTAAGANEVPASTGAGTTYTAVTVPALLATVSNTRGRLLRRGASAWEALDASTADTFVGGDGTDVTTRTAAQVRASIGAASIATETYAFGGGALDYTADPNYAPSGSTSTVHPESALLGDGSSVPLFWVLGRDYVSALARTTVPSLRVTLANTNGEQLLRGDSSTDLGANLLIPLPWWMVTTPNWTIDATVATNIAGTPCTSGSDFASCRAGIVRYHEGDGIPYTIGVVDNYSYAGDASGAQKEGRTLDGSSDTPTDISGETSGGVNVRAVRIARSGSMITISTGPNSGSLTERRKILNYKRRIGISPLAFVLALGQVKATPSSGYYAELQSFTLTPG